MRNNFPKRLSDAPRGDSSKLYGDTSGFESRFWIMVLHLFRYPKAWCYMASNNLYISLCHSYFCANCLVETIILVNLILLIDCKKNETGMDYSGEVNTTVGGFTCQHWGRQVPHRHDWGFLDDDENFCRNTGYIKQPWCYTTSPGRRWEYCDVPVCSK